MEFIAGFFMTVTEDAKRADLNAEHNVIMDDINAMVEAERWGFKYAIVPEHHFLDEYSHISGNMPVLGYLAAKTSRMHLLSGIMNPLPQLIHPARTAESVAMLDHISEGRFEFGTGRGAGSYEILGFFPDGTETNETKEVWNDVIREFPKMWTQDVYEGYTSKYWSLPPRPIRPKMNKPAHPPMWYAAGSPTSYEPAGKMGLGLIGNGVQSFEAAEQFVPLYKKGIAGAEPVGNYVNDYFTACFQPFVSEDEEKVFELATSELFALNTSLVYRYHDTFPRPDFIPQWPEVMPPMTREQVVAAQQAGALYGTPDQIRETVRRYEELGVDGIIIGVGQYGYENALETLEFFGKHIIPEFDKDPEFRTNRFRYGTE